MKQMNPGPVLAELEGMDVLTTNDVAGIKLHAIDSEQTDRLINCLLKKSDHAFSVFLEILQDIDEPSALSFLRPVVPQLEEEQEQVRNITVLLFTN